MKLPAHDTHHPMSPPCDVPPLPLVWAIAAVLLVAAVVIVGAWAGAL